MHQLIALMFPVFSAFIHPVSGGDMAWVQYTETTPVRLMINGTSSCSVDLADADALSVAAVMIDVLDNDAPGKSVPLTYGGEVRIRNAGGGNIRVSTNSLVACTVRLLESNDEPEKVISIFEWAGA